MALANLRTRTDGNEGRRTPRDSPRSTDGSIDGGPLKDSEIGYFQPDLAKSYGKCGVVTVSSNLYFREVYHFVERIKDAVIYRGEAKVKIRIPALLHRSVQL